MVKYIVKCRTTSNTEHSIYETYSPYWLEKFMGATNIPQAYLILENGTFLSHREVVEYWYEIKEG